MVKKDAFISEHDYLFGKKKDDSKIIDVKSNNDFPTLGNDFGQQRGNGKNLANKGIKGKNAIVDNEWEKNPFEEKKKDFEMASTATGFGSGHSVKT